MLLTLRSDVLNGMRSHKEKVDEKNLNGHPFQEKHKPDRNWPMPVFIAEENHLVNHFRQ